MRKSVHRALRDLAIARQGEVSGPVDATSLADAQGAAVALFTQAESPQNRSRESRADLHIGYLAAMRFAEREQG